METYRSLSLRWENGQLSILDQRKVPHNEEWVEVKDARHLIGLIQELAIRGAPLIGVCAALGLSQFAHSGVSHETWLKDAERLRKARPTAVNLMKAVDFVVKDLEFEPGWVEEVRLRAERVLQSDVKMCEGMALAGQSILKAGDRILTHCNTGQLATAGRGTALGVISLAYELGQKIHVYVDETRPLLQGGRLTTWELDRLQIPHTLICDNMAADLMRQGQVDKVLVGADRIARNGDFANKIGTYGLAVLARAHDIPFYVVAPQSTVDEGCASGSEMTIEQREASEVRGVTFLGGLSWAPELSPVWNPAFDVTPAHLVTAWILDTGIIRTFGHEAKEGVS